MDFYEIAQLMSKSFWLDGLSNLRKMVEDQQVTKDKFNYIKQYLNYFIRQNKKGRALNWLLLGLLLDQDRTIRFIRREGILRASKYDYNSDILKFLSSKIINNTDELSLKPENSSYFKSVDNLLFISTTVRKMKTNIIKELKERKPNIVKDLLATTEILFMKNYRNNQRRDSEDIEFYFRGEICEAISYLIYMYDEYVSIDNECFYNLDENYVLQFKHQDIVKEACKIKAYKAYEIYIDHYDYSCSRINHELKLYPPTVDFEKAMQYGYIFHELQSYNLYFKNTNKYIDKAQSLERLASVLSESLSSKLIVRKKEPIERFIFKFPDTDQLRLLLNSEQFFFEEIMLLTENCKDLFSDFNTLCNFKVFKSLTLFDLIKANRLFHFIRIFFTSYVEKFFETEPDLVVRSLVPVYDFEKITYMLSIVLDDFKIQDFFNLFIWDKNKRSILDLQYSPLLATSSHLIFPIHIYLFSNLLRNSLFAINKRIFDTGKSDPMTQMLVKVLKNNFDFVEYDIKFKFSGYEGDIDIIAIQDNYIFIFECKRTLLPGDVYELRTIYDNIISGANQLSKIKSAFSNNIFQQYLSKKLNCSIDNSKHVVTCIIMGNRMLSGYKCNNHPVRGLYEVANFIYSGEVEFRDGKFSLWDNNYFTPKDLYKYLEQDSYHKLVFDSMHEHNLVYRFDNYTITHNSFYLNFELLFQKYNNNYHINNKI